MSLQQVCLDVYISIWCRGLQYECYQILTVVLCESTDRSKLLRKEYLKHHQGYNVSNPQPVSEQANSLFLSQFSTQSETVRGAFKF